MPNAEIQMAKVRRQSRFDILHSDFVIHSGIRVSEFGLSA
jgi:hypothetical protein